ncbi:MAG TPA: BatA and WFA domain-containing protein [Ignavibacteria bacterium]|nr:BatA and WFA domain-containing protein [Ignavibacteria bacterium]
MSFLNPSILLALSALIIPVIIHLLNLRKIRKVEFSTLMFLREIQKSKMRRIKLRQLLLLFLRMLVIGFLVLSFSRPVFDGYAGNSISNVKTTTLIFLDDSFSMNSRDNSGEYLSKAKESVSSILSAHKETDEIYFIPFSNIGLKESKILFDNTGKISDSLKSLKLSYKYTSVNEILNFSEEVLSGSKNPLKEIYIVSDFQKNNFRDFNNQVKMNYNFKNLSGNSVNTYLIDIGSREINNLSLDSFKIVSKILEKDKELNLKISLNNFSKYDVKNKTVNLVINNELAGEKSADVEFRGKKDLDFKFRPDRTGFISGYFELVQNEFSEDELIQDNKYYFSLYIPAKFDIMFLENNSVNNADYKFIELAFKSASEFLSDSSGKTNDYFNIVRIKTIDENIFKSNMTFISNIKSFTDKEADILKEYVSKGGGLFIFPGSNTDINNYNNVLFNKLNTVRIEKLNSDEDINSGLKFDKIDFENPLISDIFKNKNLNITSEKFIVESPVIRSYYELLLNENSKPVITLNNNKVFLAESDLAEGKIVIASVSSTNDLSDLPLRNIFLPLLVRSLYYLSNNFEYQKEYVVGKNNLIPFRDIENISEIILPDKIKTNLQPISDFSKKNNNFILIPYSKITDITGEYSISDSGGKSSSFSLNYNSLESDQTKEGRDEIKKYFEKFNIENIFFIDKKSEIENSINKNRTGSDLWIYMLIFALIFLAAEIILSKKLENS